jgi:putative transposase
MAKLSFKRHRFNSDVIKRAVWLYYRFNLSLRDVEEILAERGIDVSYEAIRDWCRKFGLQIARNLRRRRPAPSPRWHLDEMVSTIGGRHMYVWRAVDDEGEVLGSAVELRRDAATAESFLRKLMRDQPVVPETIVTDGLGSYKNRVGSAGSGRPPSPRSAPREQSRGELASADPEARAADDRLQERRVSAAVPDGPRRRLQHLLHSEASHQPKRVEGLQGTRARGLARGCCIVTRVVHLGGERELS